MKDFLKFSKSCKFKESKLGMWTSGMNIECIHWKGPARCNEGDCPRKDEI